ncbi:hypothetical protein SDRG_15847 [Saprolegnia diclina VS20]|uniref:Uncharacterized protein n=1 Tax=Saprolegnia diclina (strain VS20) TaxID=1156394 RepID=T0RA14_SAPDV|nr:hypothetical protein SDRG_15847 [Saprolegnia diclina VS20]EQC26362.1 hypothetical protein SDRG_15847 [Saprolegnia diclina VS20]|eukprot:XP_008620255.1 hypothetical protein SDRG_15847 [Saprolegnia diclina VS20]
MCPVRFCYVTWCLLGVICAAIAVGLPLWSMSNPPSVTLSAATLRARMTAGVWGVCTEVHILSNATSMSAATCFSFYHASRGGLLLPNGEMVEAHNDPLCSAPHGDLVASIERRTADPTFPAFLQSSCGHLGRATLVFAYLAPIAGALALLALAFLCCCATRRPHVDTASQCLVGLAFLSAVLAFVLWTQQRPTNSYFGPSFYLAIAAAVCFFFSLISCRFHKPEAPAPPPEEPTTDRDTYGRSMTPPTDKHDSRV